MDSENIREKVEERIRQERDSLNAYYGNSEEAFIAKVMRGFSSEWGTHRGTRYFVTSRIDFPTEADHQEVRSVIDILNTLAKESRVLKAWFDRKHGAISYTIASTQAKDEDIIRMSPIENINDDGYDCSVDFIYIEKSNLENSDSYDHMRYFWEEVSRIEYRTHHNIAAHR